MRRSLRSLVVLASLVLVAGGQATAVAADTGVASASAATGSPLDLGDPTLARPPSETVRPRHFRLAATDVIAIAQGLPGPRGALASRDGAEMVAYTHGIGRWQVRVVAGARTLSLVEIEDRTGKALEASAFSWPPIPTKNNRHKSQLGYLLLGLSVLFVAPFFDPRRPFRLLHLDLLVLAGFLGSLLVFNRGEILTSVPLVYPLLAYLLVRMLVLGLRQRRAREPLIPFLPMRWLLVGLALLITFRVGYNVLETEPNDVGYAGVFGANSIHHGWQLYADDQFHLDTYGPVNYLAYLPFELVFPMDENWARDGLPAAHAASITFDLLTLLGMFLVGRRLRPGVAGRNLGVALAFAWAAFPWSFFVLALNTNDSLVAMFLVYGLLVLTSPALRGVVLALGAATKFAPLALVPLFLTAAAERSRRSMAVFAAVFVAVIAMVVLAYLPDGGLRELYEATLGFQRSRRSFYSLWGQYPELDWLQGGLQVATAALALAVAFVPRQRTPAQVAALGAAVIIALQLTTIYWFYVYLVWFAPLAFVAIFAVRRSGAADEVAAVGGDRAAAIGLPAVDAAPV